MALLLNIPPNKTLLRRHLATHFHLLIGSEAQRLKQDYLENPDYAVLTATAKVKASNHKQSCHWTSYVWIATLNIDVLPVLSHPSFSQDVCRLEVSEHWGGSDRRRQRSMFAPWMCRCLRAAVSIKAPAYLRTAWISWRRYRQFHWPGFNADKTANHSPNLF